MFHETKALSRSQNRSNSIWGPDQRVYAPQIRTPYEYRLPVQFFGALYTAGGFAGPEVVEEPARLREAILVASLREVASPVRPLGLLEMHEPSQHAMYHTSAFANLWRVPPAKIHPPSEQ